MTETIEGLVSTIIPVYNRADMLQEAVESVLAQTYRPIEVIISDDGSTDESPTVIRVMVEQHPDIIRAVFNKKGGAGPAREAGRLLAKGEFIQYLDSDDRLLPCKFEAQVEALREHPECGAAYGYIRFCPDDGPPQEEPYKWSGRELPALFPWLLIDRWWNTDCPLFRRSVTDAVGSWTDLPYSQDWEYDSRVAALGTRLVHCKEFVCEQRHHANARQTGGSNWLKPKDRVRFFSSMFSHAMSGGVSMESPQMRHFSRWVFLNARQCGALGDSEAAKQLFELSVLAAGGESRDLRIYRMFSELFGWSFSGKVAKAANRLLNRKPGAHTLKQSWMK